MTSLTVNTQSTALTGMNELLTALAVSDTRVEAAKLESQETRLKTLEVVKQTLTQINADNTRLDEETQKLMHLYNQCHELCNATQIAHRSAVEVLKKRGEELKNQRDANLKRAETLEAECNQVKAS